jgi:glycosyltransferase involved in cell wall biosynthesis
VSVKVLAFTGEVFYRNGKECAAKQTSILFLQKTFGKENVIAAAPLLTDMPNGCSTFVDINRLHEMPLYLSTKDFVRRSLLTPFFLIRYIQKIKEILDLVKSDIVWVRSPSIGSLIFAIVALRNGYRVAHHMCANAQNAWRSDKYTGLEKMFGFIVASIIGRLIAYICRHKNVINLTTGDELESIARSYAPSQTFQFVDMLVENVEITHKTKDDNGNLRVLFVGRIVRDKGIFDLAHVIALCPNISLVVVGDGPDFEELKEYSNRFPKDKIDLRGQLPHSELNRVFNQIDVVCVPSNNKYEGFPRVIMEAWAHGKAVVVSDVGGVKAFVRNGENGLIFKPGSLEDLRSVLEIVWDDEMRARLECEAKRMGKFSTQNYWASKVKEIFDVA